MRHSLRTLFVLTAVALVLVVLAVGCQQPLSTPRAASPQVSQDVTAVVSAQWLADLEPTVRSLVLTPDGELRQVLANRTAGLASSKVGSSETVRAGGIHVGTWKAVGVDRLYFELPNIPGFFPHATYRFKVDGDTLTLTFVSGDPFIGGNDHRVIRFNRKR